MKIKLFNKVITIFKFEVEEEYKKKVVENIERANSCEYQMQVAEHSLFKKVIDDMFEDPYWREIMIEANNHRLANSQN